MADKFSSRCWAKVDRYAGLDGCWPWTASGCEGYGRIGNGESPIRMLRANRVVCEWAHGPCPENMEARHLCGNRACCNPLHVEWSTHKENCADKLAHGTAQNGERNPYARLTALAVVEIRKRRDSGEAQNELARVFGVCEKTISNVVRHKTWATIEQPMESPLA